MTSFPKWTPPPDTPLDGTVGTRNAPRGLHYGNLSDLIVVGISDSDSVRRAINEIFKVGRLDTPDLNALHAILNNIGSGEIYNRVGDEPPEHALRNIGPLEPDNVPPYIIRLMKQLDIKLTLFTCHAPDEHAHGPCPMCRPVHIGSDTRTLKARVWLCPDRFGPNFIVA